MPWLAVAQMQENKIGNSQKKQLSRYYHIGHGHFCVMLVKVEIILVRLSTNATVNWLYRRWPVDKVLVRLVYACNVEHPVKEVFLLVTCTAVLIREGPFVVVFSLLVAIFSLRI